MRTVELFAGYGSQDLELTELGIKHDSVAIAEVDIDAIIGYGALRFQDTPFECPAVDVMRKELMYCDVGYDFKKDKSKIPKLPVKKLKKLYKYHVLSKNLGNVSTLEHEDVPDHDLLTYSFPCQDISGGGNQEGLDEGSGTRSSLLWECRRIIKGKLPKYLMMENVKNLMSKRHVENFNKWKATLDGFGYNTYVKIINAKWCGVPQNRERVFAVSIRKDVDFGQFHFEDDFDNGVRLKDILESLVDAKYYVDTPTTRELVKSLNAGYLTVREPTKLGYKKAYPGDSINVNYPNSKTRRGRVGDQMAQTLTTQSELAVVIEPKIIKVGNISPSGFNSMDVYSPEGISKALLANGGGNTEPKVYDNLTIRKLTPRECGRLMGLSDVDIDKLINEGISNAQLYKMFGNSIVKQCMRFLKNLEVYDEHITCKC